ncbi:MULTISPECIES: glycine--tRNA ligase subunit beta [unclassified Exiguobacterium]|uniref:glycine--tRNA ligase subunit beta n=1 Tax=unclassified Exiguobacterium TaxID=2644629 RepID=UPI00103E1115|nr:MULTISPECIES: glycine--tRNA ligase subunit beta [unclassified Exiguobacterium]TCI47732.1 glycine--tRNA ligase subunit beta [Exiguobacterium sp. SH5S32]TCI54616.1 glycine--tRNA ligase subunit beta [Exiguobacterium sp. SH1S4]TCI74412.1 glycine--tRNA ligase subunit beta [Exiguobacterium sp. SH1S1]
MRDLLLEIGLEELPAQYVLRSEKQLGERVATFLSDARVNFGAVTVYSTPRRLAVLVRDVEESQQDLTETLRGPAKKIAQDADGNWSKAAAGFARGRGLSVDDLYFAEEKGVEYVFANRHESGQPTASLLGGLEDVVRGMTFPKNMKWGTSSLRYMRPIRWLVAMFGTEQIDFEIEGVKTGNVTRGHRFLSKGDVTISSPDRYAATLEQEFVVASYDDRRERIERQIEQLANEQGWTVPLDASLLEEVTNLVEWPTALFGEFDASYLDLPEEVLITTMKEHQRYFPVYVGDTLQHYFVTVRNGNADHLQNVAKGNEKVIRARLADAVFFYEEDKKTKIDDQLDRLDRIVFHEKLGTTGAKVRRVQQLALTLAPLFSADAQKVERAGKIHKFDLVSQMVYEFTELQGVMGEKYALQQGEDKEVAAAIREHYMPRFAGDASPATPTGAALALADKLDSIAAFFGVGMIPSGSQDPFALRRQAQGVVQILGDWHVDLPVDKLLSQVVESQVEAGLYDADKEQVKAQLNDFFMLRLKYRLQERQVRYDVIDAVLTTGLTVEQLDARAEAVQNMLSDEAKQLIEQLTRVVNIAKKGEPGLVNPALFENAEEKALHAAVESTLPETHEAVEVGDYTRAITSLRALEQPISAYFENTMVMSDVETIRHNRLSEMKRLATTIERVADFSALVL